MVHNPDLLQQWRMRLDESRRALAQSDTERASGSSANLRLYRYLLSNYGAARTATPHAVQTPPPAFQQSAASRNAASLDDRTPPKSHAAIRAALKSVHAANSEMQLPMHLWLRYARSDEQPWLTVASTQRHWALDLCWNTLQRCGISARKVRRRSEIILEVPLADFVEASSILKRQRHSLHAGQTSDLLAHPLMVSGIAAIYGGVIGGAFVVLLDMLYASFLKNGATSNDFEFQVFTALGWGLGAFIGLGVGRRSLQNKRASSVSE